MKLLLLLILSLVVVIYCDNVYNDITSSQSQVFISNDKLRIINSETKPGNLLPNFLFMQGSIEGGSVGVPIGGGRGNPRPFTPDDSCGDDIFDGALEDERSPQLPYLTQDLWGCERKDDDISVWTMQNDYLKVTITPQYAGKVWGIFDKVRQKELLYANRAHQPANIAALKAWAAGGAEWNWSPGIIGHSVFSETQVYLTQVNTKRGPMLRVYEFDRYNGTVWQVDMILNNDSFIVHPRITNPTDKDLRGYWWTCVAIDAKPSTRVFTPATHVAETSRGSMRNAPWPYFAEGIENGSFTGFKNAWPTDNSYLGNHQIGDMFLRIPDTVYTPYIGHTQEDGYVLIHGHPLNGTKFYTWGQSGPGRFMQDFLAGGGKGNGYYAELQVGPAPTQMQSFPVPKGSIREWTEWFKGFDGDKENLKGDYNSALNEIDTWMRSSDGMPKKVVDDWDQFFEEHAEVEPSTVLVQGQPWGFLEEKRLGRQLAPGLKFTEPFPDTQAYMEIKPWLDLLEKGTFTEETLKYLPLSYQTTDGWMELLQKSAETHGMTWLHALHIGIGLTERGDIDEPIKLFETSFALKPNPIAARCLGILQKNYDDSFPYYIKALESLENFKNDKAYFRLMDNLVTETSFFLQQWGRYDIAEDFMPKVPEAHRGLDAFITLQIKFSLNHQKYQDALSLLSSNCFPTYASARLDLMNMWNSAVEGQASLVKGSSLSILEKHQARMKDPIPDNIGCQYASEYCINYCKSNSTTRFR